MTRLAVEDDFNDVIGKAQKGLGISTDLLSEKSQVSGSKIRDIRKGLFDEQAVEALARCLNLNVNAVMEIGRQNWYPSQPESIKGFELISTPFHAWSVNSFLIWDPKSKRAAAFDTGTDAVSLIHRARSLGLNVDALYLTHTHWDHIEGVNDLKAAWGMKIFVNKHEPNPPVGAELIREGFEASVGELRMRVIETTGHTPGGTTFVIDGLSRQVAVVGDALFAGSMGGPSISYRQCLTGVSKILSLDEDTVLAPGHGPLTTVGEERNMNCFYSR